MFLLVAGLQAAWGQRMIVSMNDEGVLEVDVSRIKQVFFVENGAPFPGEHEYIEIGGLKWATMNLGATTVAGSFKTCFGNYYAWGETVPRYASMKRTSASVVEFTWKDSYIGGYGSGSTFYAADSLDAAHDAATVNWGGTWRTPTKEDFEALAMACSGSESNIQTPVRLISPVKKGGIYWLSATQTIEPAYTGVAGMLFVCASDINRRLFFPAAGHVLDGTLYNGGACGYYWSSSPFTSTTDLAYYLYFHSSGINPSNNFYRYQGRTVRPVSD